MFVILDILDKKTVMIIMNNSKENQTINTARFKENIKEFTTATNILTD
jgi:hypothetical protein